MAYSVTGFRSAPDVGFQAQSRRTAEGARECALAFIGDGLREVEVRDGNGNLRGLHELDNDDVWSFDVIERLAAL